MARRTSAIEDLMNITSKLPWWGGVRLAFISYYFSGQRLATPSGKQAINTVFLLGHIGITAESIFKYVLPMVFLVGSAVSAIVDAKRKRFYCKVQGNTDLQTLRGPKKTRTAKSGVKDPISRGTIIGLLTTKRKTICTISDWLPRRKFRVMTKNNPWLVGALSNLQIIGP